MRIGVDVGGTKIEVAALDPDLRLRRRVPTPRHDYPALVEAVVGLVEEVESELGRTGTVGVGHPGAISPASGLIKNSNSTVLLGRDLQGDLEAALDRPVRLANDANCFALSEAVDGAAAGREVVFGVILGTGVGGGVVVSRQPLVGRNAIAGEWGHNPLPPSRAGTPGAHPCYCGKLGCIETYLSGPGLALDHRIVTGSDLAPEAVAQAASAGESAAMETLDRYLERLAAALALVVNVLDPDAIVLGGGLSNIDALYEEVPLRWDRYVFSDRVDTELLRNEHGDSGGVRGAAWLWGESER